jgi:hypothetical protein
LAVLKINRLRLKIIKSLKYFHPLFLRHTAASRFKEQVLMIEFLTHNLAVPCSLLQATYNSLQDKEACLEDLARFLWLLALLGRLAQCLLIFLKDPLAKDMNQQVLKVLLVYFIVIFLAPKDSCFKAYFHPIIIPEVFLSIG